MITTKHFAALLGFAFVAACIGFNFGDAILCLIGAAAFYAVAAFMQGELDLGDLQARLSGGSSAAPAPPPRSRTNARSRVK